MGRITREQMFMEIARIASKRSTCFRLNVGALVVHQNNPIALGYNGQEPGQDHCLGNDCPGIIPGNCGTRHAEVNALNKAKAIMGPHSIKEVDLYCTDSPCSSCVDYILSERLLRVTRLFYETPYRDVSHLEKLRGIMGIYLVTPAGYIVNHFTRRVVEFP